MTVRGGLRREALPLTVALLLPGVGLLVGVLLLVPCLRLGCALLVPRRLLAVLRVSCGGRRHTVRFWARRHSSRHSRRGALGKAPDQLNCFRIFSFTTIRVWRYSRSDTINTI